MAESLRIEDVNFVPVTEERLKEFIHKVSDMGDIFAGTNKEFKHYYTFENNRFFHIVNAKSSQTIGIICFVSHNDRNISSVIVEKKDSQAFLPLTFEILGETERTIVCVNAPSSIISPSGNTGELIWKIHEYSADVGDIRYNQNSPPVIYEVQLEIPEAIDAIVACDMQLFKLCNRKDFIGTCAGRSEVIYSVRATRTRKLLGFGMLSKAKKGKRLLGPVYAPGVTVAKILVDCLLDYAKRNDTGATIVAYLPEDCRGCIVLCKRGFKMTTPTKEWERSLYNNYNISKDNIVALGSLLFDVC